MRRLSILALVTTGLTACSYGDGFSDRHDDQPNAVSDTDTDTDADSETAYEGPSFWKLEGHIQLAEGAVVPESTVLEVQFMNEDGAPWAPAEGMVAPCVLQGVEVSDGPSDSLQGEPLLGWWQIDTIDVTDEVEPCPWPIPVPVGALDTEEQPLVLGIGAFDSRLTPAMQAAGFAPGLDLYSLYVLHPTPDDDVVYVFGLAGTEAQFAGDDTTVDAKPVPDGRYDLETLVLLPVPEASER